MVERVYRGQNHQRIIAVGGIDPLQKKKSNQKPIDKSAHY